MDGRWNSTNATTVTQKAIEQREEASYTICDKMSVSENKTMVQYLFDQGKCGDICRNG